MARGSLPDARDAVGKRIALIASSPMRGPKPHNAPLSRLAAHLTSSAKRCLQGFSRVGHLRIFDQENEQRFKLMPEVLIDIS